MDITLNPTLFLFVLLAGLIAYSAWTDHTTMKIFNSANICVAIIGLTAVFVLPDRPSIEGTMAGALSAGIGYLLGWLVFRWLDKRNQAILTALPQAETPEAQKARDKAEVRRDDLTLFATTGSALATFVALSWAAGRYFFTPTAGDVSTWLDLSTASAVTFSAIFILYGMLRMGGGDIKFIAALSIWFGYAWSKEFLLIAGALGGLLAIVTLVAVWLRAFDPWNIIDRALPYLKIGNGRTIPYGVSIAAAAFIVMTWQAQELEVI